ncbi:ATP-binding protein [Streptomyces sp. NBC_01788]|uniref:ATP-binding protein n=1 Tax=Streptomyces sp. NBC_01788 TaxID=2975940 RepID=UPI003FA3DA99
MPLDPARLIVAELAANAAVHGRVAGRSLRLTLTAVSPATLRSEVTDTRGDRQPERMRTTDDEFPRESGYGLLLVDELADRWGYETVRCRPKPCGRSWTPAGDGLAVSRAKPRRCSPTRPSSNGVRGTRWLSRQRYANRTSIRHGRDCAPGMSRCTRNRRRSCSWDCTFPSCCTRVRGGSGRAA